MDKFFRVEAMNERIPFGFDVKPPQYPQSKGCEKEKVTDGGDSKDTSHFDF